MRSIGSKRLFSLPLWTVGLLSKRPFGYALAVLVGTGAIELTRIFQESFSITAPLLLCFLAAILTAWYGGFRAALIAIGLSTLLFDYYFVAPFGSLAASPADIGVLGLFVFEASLFAYLIDYLKCSHEEAVTNKEQLKRLHEYSAALLKEQAIEPMFAQVLEASIDLLKAEKGWIQVCRPQGGLQSIHVVGFGADHDVIARLSLLSSEACDRKRAIRFDEVGLQGKFSGLASLLEEHQIGDTRSTPLLDADGRCFGVVSTCTRPRQSLLERDIAVFDLYLDQARRILATKLNEEKLQKLSADLEQEVFEQKENLVSKEEHIRLLRSDLALMEQRERRQLAAELHDYLCQLLALAQIKIKQARKSIPTPSVECERHLQETDTYLRRSVSYARSLMAELYPPSLNDSGLPAALRWLAGQMSFHDLTVDVEMSCDTVTIPKDQAIVLYRSVRELLINVSKHARVNRATLCLEIEKNNILSISVQDRGRGFDPSSPKAKNPGHNYGLASVSERLMSIGGWLKAESIIGQGSNLTLYLPLESPASESLRAAASVHQERVWSTPMPASNQDQLPLL